MRKFVCGVCGYVYEEAAGRPEGGIAPGTRWEDLPDTWTCPLCGAAKSEFSEEGAAPAAAPVNAAVQLPLADDLTEMTPGELSALCSNLARGCEKQYKPTEAGLFTQLADFFKGATPKADDTSVAGLLEKIDSDLNSGFPAASAVATTEGDRGALRALVWSEKVTKILKSLLTRYQTEGDSMLANTGVYVCTICGFVYVGDTPPDICPVCKVPSWKFEKIEGRAS